MSFTLPIRPTTKKTSSQIVSFGKPCYACKKKPFQKVIPSDLFLEFEDECFKIGPVIRRTLEARGVTLPIEGPVSVRALIYRDADRGDWNGFTDAIADILQEPIFEGRKVKRKGIGIITNDKNIEHWDGTRRLIDRDNPRVEITISTIDPPLFAGAQG